jgi:hypothetical protein
VEANNQSIQWHSQGLQAGIDCWKNGYLQMYLYFDDSFLRENYYWCLLTEITQPCVHTCASLFICQLYLLPNLLEEMDCKEDTPLTLPFCIVCLPLTVDNSDMN